jgi:hypothetical protein
MDITRRRLVIASATCAATAGLSRESGAFAAAPQGAFRPGQRWLDSAGKPIQAHAGSLIAVGRDYYWYGENKEFTDGKRGIESWGIRFYRSKNLYDWDDLGPLIPPNIVDADSPLSPKVVPERPHILFNPKTRKFVCWIKIRGQGPQFRTVMTADRITGPYTIVHPALKPAGMAAGDFDILADPASGKAYMYFEHDHSEVVCIELSEDWTDVTDRYTQFYQRRVPDTREGIACFRRQGLVYLTSSGMTGYFPNPSEIAVAHDYRGPFAVLGDLHPSDQSRTSFNSQISSIFKHPTRKDLFIALADRWLPNLTGQPDFENGTESRLVHSAIAKAKSLPREPFTDAEAKILPQVADTAHVNTSVSRYVWLPLSFEGAHPTIAWRDEWRWEDFG